MVELFEIVLTTICVASTRIVREIFCQCEETLK
jgi:hypothetical protein